MLNFKRASLQSHILVIIIISMIMAFLLVFLLNGIYGKDNIKCLDVKFEVNDLCKVSKNAITFDLINDYSGPLKFNINSKKLPDYFINSGDKKKIALSIKDSNILEIIPIVSDEDYNYECHGKILRKNVEVIKKC